MRLFHACERVTLTRVTLDLSKPMRSALVLVLAIALPAAAALQSPRPRLRPKMASVNPGGSEPAWLRAVASVGRAANIGWRCWSIASLPVCAAAVSGLCWRVAMDNEFWRFCRTLVEHAKATPNFGDAISTCKWSLAVLLVGPLAGLAVILPVMILFKIPSGKGAIPWSAFLPLMRAHLREQVQFLCSARTYQYVAGVVTASALVWFYTIDIAPRFRLAPPPAAISVLAVLISAAGGVANARDQD